MQQHSRKSYRKKVVSQETRTEEDLQQDVSVRLLQTRELQKLRGRSKGVNAGVGAEFNLPPSVAQYPFYITLT